jgi:hypothetical protein
LLLSVTLSAFIYVTLLDCLLLVLRGWSSGKSLFVWPEDIGKAYEGMDHRPRGVMYWDINEDDKGVNGTNVTCDFATGLNRFLHVRGGRGAGGTIGLE